MKVVDESSPNLLKRMSQSPALRAIGTMAGATGLGQLAIFATLPLLTRLYDPAAFGLHALIMAFVGVASVGACLSLELAIVQAPSVDAADELCAAALYSAPLTAAFSGLVLAVFVGAGLFGYGNLPWWSVPIAGIMVGLNGLYVASRYRQLREQSYTILVHVTFAQSGGRALAPLAWFLVFPIWAGLTLGELTGRLLGVRGLLRPLLQQLRATAGWGSPRAWWSIVRRERRYTTVLLATVLVDSCASLLIVPLLAEAFGAKAAGEYFLVATLLVAPSALLGTAAADLLHTRGALLYHQSPAQLPAFFHRAALLLLLTGSVIYLSVYFLAPIIFPLLFGKKWTLIAPIAQAMTPFMIVAFVASPCSRLLLVLNRTGLKVISDTVRLIGTPVVIVTASSLHFSFDTTMWALTWFLAAAYGLYFLLTLFAVTAAARPQHATC